MFYVPDVSANQSLEPKIPERLFRPMTLLRRMPGQHDAENGGQWRPGSVERISFQGALLPVTDKDLRFSPAGTYTLEDQKIYTNGFELTPGEEVDVNGRTYSVVTELSHSYIHGMHRYIVRARRDAFD